MRDGDPGRAARIELDLQAVAEAAEWVHDAAAELNRALKAAYTARLKTEVSVVKNHALVDYPTVRVAVGLPIEHDEEDPAR